MTSPRDRFLIALDLFSAEARAAADGLGRRSACSGWTIGDVVRHVTGVQREHAGVALLQEEEAAPSAPVDETEALDAWELLSAELRSAAVDAEDDAFGELAMPTLDLALHAWDIRWGTIGNGLGRNLEFPRALLEWMEEFRWHANEASVRGPGIFAAAVVPPDGATASERLAAWAGRDPRVAA
ncbi:maleylpyruvate isomerase N-terminal domain-containing protein [Agrococcus sp. SL85]|uniref:maleylpyruvate isomerase N-terminal domain-containing protein n=1 Tax=Agrococcus sp. SL85 TaxID=2995141 RepID=UPI00226CE00B|nr:maleylpyruvate isomerase N-terminal domain-containing protein [Agrococcus sp. SL85]WAC67240.1 maleylpyruvate isomerase N-terminal domain-containing protein [Agrococcus sp. SL85]